MLAHHNSDALCMGNGFGNNFYYLAKNWECQLEYNSKMGIWD